MPKDTEDKRYLNPAIPRTSRLLAHLEKISAETGITESQLLVLFASEYVRLMVDGPGVVSVTAAPAATSMALPAGIPSEPEPQGSLRTLDAISIEGDENFESFGDPD